ncbi:hypothetical protein [Paenibacillus agricola]|uniref:Uncharacterized protein n=1 Tax=Paenibacillus agricola TaxID=2716264 RepID=A0ABX0JAS8_9BACL|nr:hypothetical protein [Paenibacillus agricola]NHN33509.1 hypothetical protein [Paenibacillus agricola]
MSVQINITGDSAIEAVKEFSVLAAHFTFPAAGTADATKSDKPVATRNRSVAKPVETEKPVESAAADASEEGSQTKGSIEDDFQDDDAPVPTVVDLRAKAQEVAKTLEGKAAVKLLLAGRAISNIPEEERAAFLVALEAL